MNAWVIIIFVVIVVILYFNKAASEDYTTKDYSEYVERNQRIANGFSGVGYTGGIGATLGRRFTIGVDSVGGLGSFVPIGPGTTSDYNQYSMYSTKIWPDEYQPVTNTCFDEYMAACSPTCTEGKCLNNCQVNATKRCVDDIPKLVHRR